MRLAVTLDMPLRERNALLVAAGYAARYPERPLGTPELGPVRRAIELMLEHHEPYPALVIDRYWELVTSNGAATRFFEWLRGGSAHTNVMRQVFDPSDVRATLANWEEVASDLIRHLHGQITATPSDVRARALLDEVLRYPDVPDHWRSRNLDAAPAPLLTVVFRKGEREPRFFSTITTFGTPRDITLDELHIESWFPADDATAALCRELSRRA